MPSNNPTLPRPDVDNRDISDTFYPFLRLRETGTGTVRLEMAAVVGGVLQWQQVPIVPSDAPMSEVA